MRLVVIGFGLILMTTELDGVDEVINVGIVCVKIVLDGLLHCELGDGAISNFGHDLFLDEVLLTRSGVQFRD